MLTPKCSVSDPEPLVIDEHSNHTPKEKSKFIDSEKWLAVTNSGKALRYNSEKGSCYIPIYKAKEVIEGKREKASLSFIEDGEFLESDIELQLTKSGDGIALIGASDRFMLPTSQVKEMINKNREAAKFSIYIHKQNTTYC